MALLIFTFNSITASAYEATNPARTVTINKTISPDSYEWPKYDVISSFRSVVIQTNRPLDDTDVIRIRVRNSGFALGDSTHSLSRDSLIDLGNNRYAMNRNVSSQSDGIIIFNDGTQNFTLSRLEIHNTTVKISVPVDNVLNLNYELLNNTDVTFSYDFSEISDFSHLKVYQDSTLLMEKVTQDSFTVTGLEFDTKYDFKIVAVDTFGNESSGLTRTIFIPENPDLLPSGDIFNMDYSVKDTSIAFSYDLPLDSRFSHLKIYRNNVLIHDDYKLNTFNDSGLIPETEYKYDFVSVNKEDISSNGYSVSTKTSVINNDVPPEKPKNLKVYSMNSALNVNWDSNTESDLRGYYVYLDDELVTTSPIRSSAYTFSNLTNDQSYSVRVVAVDNFDNLSESSVSVSGTPLASELPIFTMPVSLGSVSLSVTNWFSQLWLVTAFAVSIPLSFLIAQRVKSLFLS